MKNNNQLKKGENRFKDKRLSNLHSKLTFLRFSLIVFYIAIVLSSSLYYNGEYNLMTCIV